METRTPQQRRAQLKTVSDLFATARTQEELEWILEDLLTPAEIQDVQERWLIVKLLLEGKTQREVSRQTGVSISKVTRAAHVLTSGARGFRLLFEKKGKR